MPQITREKITTKPKHKGGGTAVQRIAPLTFDEEAGININAYGKSGTGKTTIACTFPKPLLIIGAEDGTKSVYNVKGVEFVRINNSSEIGELVSHIQQTGKYKTVLMDTASSLQDMILTEILGLDEPPIQLSWGLASRGQWGQCVIQTKERLRSLIELPCNTFISAQERVHNSDEESTENITLDPYISNGVTPSVNGWLTPKCDYVVQTFIRQQTKKKTIKVGGKPVTELVKTGKVEYCIRTYPDPAYTIKFRVPKGTPLPEAIVDPCYEDIINLIRGKHVSSD